MARIILPGIVSMLVILSIAHTESTDNVLDRYIQTVGGETKLEQIRSLIVEMEVISPSGKQSEGNIYFDKFRGYCQTIVTDTAEIRLSCATDKMAWRRTPDGYETIPGTMENHVSLQEFICPVYKFHEKQLEYSLMGTTDLDSITAYKIREIDNQSNDTSYIYIDTVSYLMVRTETPGEIIAYSDYFEKEGLKFYGKYEILDGLVRNINLVKSVRIDQEIPKSMFAVPDEIQTKMSQGVVKTMSRGDIESILEIRMNKFDARFDRLSVWYVSIGGSKEPETEKIYYQSGDLHEQTHALFDNLIMAGDEDWASVKDRFMESLNKYDIALSQLESLLK